LSSLRASQNAEKLALIHKTRYINDDFGGVDLPPTGHLKTFETSHSADKNRAKPLLQRLTAPFSVAAMVATTALATPAFGNDAATATQTIIPPVAAQNAKPTPASMADVVVPIRNSRGIALETVQVSAGAASNNGIVVVFYGQDRQAFAEMKDVIREAIFNGLPVRGMMVSDAKERGSIEIWADTDFFGGEVAPFDNLSNKMRNTLGDAADYVTHMQTRAAQTAALDSSLTR